MPQELAKALFRRLAELHPVALDEGVLAASSMLCAIRSARKTLCCVKSSMVGSNATVSPSMRPLSATPCLSAADRFCSAMTGERLERLSGTAAEGRFFPLSRPQSSDPLS